VCGGGLNHRLGLFDAILIKENHVSAAGGISSAVASARRLHPDFPIEVEVESIAEFREALSVQADQIMLDNFSISLLHEAVAINLNEGRPPAKIEASGGLTIDEIASVAATGVDYISVGALTKNIHAIDLSMRFD
jgi:nicotinate-nucleotide pyrophosphorylase (carboxylating)